jgi:ubiquinone/menaquinone biosynthesis C-methylase UbiE
MNANVAVPSVPRREQMFALSFRCPVCHATLGPVEVGEPEASSSCRECGFLVAKAGGIWRALAPMRELYYSRFVTEYTAIRAREGRGSDGSDYYLALPFRDLTGRNTWQWKIRARSFEFFSMRVLPMIEARRGPRLRVLDIGAGNGWLSYRLSLRGHASVAVDLLDNHQDGLGAAWHYERQLTLPFVCVQTEMDNLPFGDAQFDIAVFNASFHYSENYSRTLREAIRCLRPGGEVIVMDSPFYCRDDSGRAMVLEKHATFQQQHGYRSDSIRSLEFLTPQILADLEQACGLRWRIGRPWYGLSWASRGWKAKLRGRREPAKFYVFSATVGQ